MSKTHRYLVTTAGSMVNSRTVHKQKLALVIQKQESVTKPSVMVAVLETGPALGMFEEFGRTGPPTLGGRHFGP